MSRLGTIWHRWSDRTTDVSRCSRYDLFADVHAPYLEIPLRVFLMPVKVCRWFQCRAEFSSGACFCGCKKRGSTGHLLYTKAPMAAVASNSCALAAAGPSRSLHS